jgi:predicted dehydrogenase
VNHRVGIVGLGRISAHHLEALEQFPSVDVVGGVDVNHSRRIVFRGGDIPIYVTLADLLAHDPTSLIIATPTATHHALGRDAMLASDGKIRILVEKPLAATLADVTSLLATDTASSLDVIYHAAHAPEVMWAYGRIARWKGTYGRITAHESLFADPYLTAAGAAEDVYVNSWMDSGINALSVALRFLDLKQPAEALVSAEEESAYSRRVPFDDGGSTGMATFRTTWDMAHPVKYTRLLFESGAELLLDHQAMTGGIGLTDLGGEAFAYASDVPRLVAHYIGAFSSLFISRESVYTTAQTRLLHSLLLG